MGLINNKHKTNERTNGGTTKRTNGGTTKRRNVLAHTYRRWNISDARESLDPLGGGMNISDAEETLDPGLRGPGGAVVPVSRAVLSACDDASIVRRHGRPLRSAAEREYGRSISRRIRSALEDQGKGPKWLADRLQLRESGVDYFLTGTNTASVWKLQKVADVLGVGLSEFLPNDGEPRFEREGEWVSVHE